MAHPAAVHGRGGAVVITIRRLRKDAPSWTWTAVRSGFGGYEYLGSRQDEMVRVHAVAVLCGPTEDDYSTEWRADDGSVSRHYFGWLSHQNPMRSLATPAAREGGDP